MSKFKKVLRIINFFIVLIVTIDSVVFSYPSSQDKLRIPSALQDEKESKRMVSCAVFLASNQSTGFGLPRRTFLKAAAASPFLRAIEAIGQNNEPPSIEEILRLFKDENGNLILDSKQILEIKKVFKEEVLAKNLSIKSFVESPRRDEIIKSKWLDSNRFVTILLSSLIAYFDKDILPLINKRSFNKQDEYNWRLYSSCMPAAFFAYIPLKLGYVSGVRVVKTYKHIVIVVSMQEKGKDSMENSPVSFLDIANDIFVTIGSLYEYYESQGERGCYVLRPSKRIKPFDSPLGYALIRFKKEFSRAYLFPDPEKTIKAFLRSEGLEGKERAEERRLLILNLMYPRIQIKDHTALISDLLETVGSIYADINNASIEKDKMALRKKELNAYERAINIDPDNAEIFYNRAKVFVENFIALGDSKELKMAVESLNEAIKLDPSYSLAHYELGSIYSLYYKDYDKALEAFKNAIDYDPYNWRAYIGLGKIYYAKRMDQMAIDLFAKALVIDGEAIDYINKDVIPEVKKRVKKLADKMKIKRDVGSSV